MNYKIYYKKIKKTSKKLLTGVNNIAINISTR